MEEHNVCFTHEERLAISGLTRQQYRAALSTEALEEWDQCVESIEAWEAEMEKEALAFLAWEQEVALANPDPMPETMPFNDEWCAMQGLNPCVPHPIDDDLPF